MSKRGRAAWAVALVVVTAAAWPPVASAQWYLGEAFGGNHSAASTVAIRAGPSLTVDFHGVRWEAKPLRPRRYFVVRGGYLGVRNGFEIEYLHFKAIADTSRSYDVTIGAGTPLTAADVQPMDSLVQTYRMDSGVNLISVLYVRRLAVGTSRLAVLARAGGGVTVPYAWTTIAGQTVRHYELGGPGAQGAIGVELRLWPPLFLTADYKLTAAPIGINVAGGKASTTLWTQHGTVGLRYAFPK
jgi:hypothetical protein